jgi:ACS family hexuronate transporter-like MFS transporter
MPPEAADRYTSRVIFVLILVAQFVGSLGLFSLGALAPLMRAALHLSREQCGAMSATCLFGAVCACLPTGWLADRVGVRWLLIAGQGMSGVALVALLLKPTYGILLVGMLCVGVAYGMTMVLTTKALADWFPRERRATVIGAKFLAHSSAGSVAGLVLPTVALELGWRQAFAVVGGLLLATAGCALCGYHDRRQARPPIAPQVAATGRRLWRDPHFRRLLVTGFLFGGAFFTFTGYLTLYLHERLGYTPVLAGSLLALAHGAAAASRVPYGWVSDRWLRGDRRILLRGMMIVAIGALLALLLLPPGTPTPVLAMVILLYGVSGLAPGGLYHTLATEQAGRDTQGFGAGLASTLLQLGGAATPRMFGALVDATGSYTAAWGLLVLGLLGALGLLGPARSVRVPCSHLPTRPSPPVAPAPTKNP